MSTWAHIDNWSKGNFLSRAQNFYFTFVNTCNPRQTNNIRNKHRPNNQQAPSGKHQQTKTNDRNARILLLFLIFRSRNVSRVLVERLLSFKMTLQFVNRVLPGLSWTRQKMEKFVRYVLLELIRTCMLRFSSPFTFHLSLSSFITRFSPFLLFPFFPFSLLMDYSKLFF